MRFVRVLGLCALVVPAVAHAGPKGQEGRLVLTSQTEGAQVFIDGELRGTTPLKEPLVLKPGKYTLKLSKRGFTEYIDVFTIKPKRDTKLDIDLLPVAGVLRITSNVEKARIFVDGKFVGETPLEAEVAAGSHELKVTKGGYRDLVQKVELMAGQPQNVDLTLVELPPDQNPFRPLPPRPPRWYETWWLWAVVAGGTTVLAVAIAVPSYYLTRNPIDSFGPKFCWGAGVSCP